MLMIWWYSIVWISWRLSYIPTVIFSSFFFLNNVLFFFRYALLYDPVISNLARQAMKTLPRELVKATHAKVWWVFFYIVKWLYVLKDPAEMNSFINISSRHCSAQQRKNYCAKSILQTLHHSMSYRNCWMKTQLSFIPIEQMNLCFVIGPCCNVISCYMTRPFSLYQSVITF